LGEKLHLTAEEVQKLHQEILEQETLIRGYQVLEIQHQDLNVIDL
jgi:hypothetical protein